MNNSTRIALDIIERREQAGEMPYCATWVEIYRGVQPYGIDAERMQRELNNGVKEGYLVKMRGVNGDMYAKPTSDETQRG